MDEIKGKGLLDMRDKMNGITQFRLLIINNVLRNGQTNFQKWKHTVRENASLEGPAKFGGEETCCWNRLGKAY